MEDPVHPRSLVGKWYGRYDGEPVAMEFLSDGRLAYAVVSSGKTQVMKMTWRAEGNMLVTDQPSSPAEQKTDFSFDGADLILNWGGVSTRFSR